MAHAIKHCKQLRQNGCMSACLAMLTELDVEDVMDAFHNDYIEGNTTPQRFLQENGVTYIYETRSDEFQMGRLLEGFIYLLSCPSLSVRNKTHTVLLDLRSSEPKVYDPSNKGRAFGHGELDLRCWSIELIITSRIADSLMVG